MQVMIMPFMGTVLQRDVRRAAQSSIQSFKQAPAVYFSLSVVYMTALQNALRLMDLQTRNIASPT